MFTDYGPCLLFLCPLLLYVRFYVVEYLHSSSMYKLLLYMLSKAVHDVNMNWFACVSQCSIVNTCMLQCMMPLFSFLDHRQ